jgi:glutathione S-transferase
MHELILHHYPNSPFAEKARLALGLKQLAWRSVIIPMVMPKPDLVALTGGYRRTPVLQIGADIYCDTQCIARELERRAPEPTLYPQASAGLAHALAFWADRTLFQTAVSLVFGTLGDLVPKEFVRDREQLRGAPFDVAAMKAAAPHARDQLRAHLGLIEAQLRAGRSFLLGDAPGLVDLCAYHPLWFVRNLPPLAGALEAFPLVRAWMDRVAALGHGSPRELGSREALEIARAAEPAALPAADPGDPSGRKPGDRVSVAPDDYGKDPVVGELVASTAHEVAIRRSDPQAGSLVVRFPREGYVVSPA